MSETNVISVPKKLSKAFSPKDKLFLICSPLGGYSLLNETKYHISFMKPPQELTPLPAALDWQKLNRMLAAIANSGANALREFPWWSESYKDTAALVPFSFLPDQQKHDLTQLESNLYLQNQRKIAKLANLYGLTYIFSVYNASEKRVKSARNASPWKGSNNIHSLSNYFYGEDAAPLREYWEMKLLAAFEDTDTMFELCNEPDPKAAAAMAETYSRLTRNNIHLSRILTGWDMLKKEKNPVYANYYRQWRNHITFNFGKAYEQHIKKISWSTIHKISIDTLEAYWHHGLKPGQEIPSNSSRNTIYSTDGVRSPRPSLTDTEKITETIIDVKDKAAQAGRIGIEVVYGKETNVNPVDAIEGVSSGFRKKFDRFPGNYKEYPEPLPLPI